MQVSAEHKVVRIFNVIPLETPVQGPTLLFLHCRSGSDDLKLTRLVEYHYYDIKFRVSFWDNTLFWCDFTWGKYIQSFEVFNAETDDCSDERYCNWQVKGDAFYFAKGEFPKNSDFTKKYDWNQQQ